MAPHRHRHQAERHLLRQAAAGQIATFQGVEHHLVYDPKNPRCLRQMLALAFLRDSVPEGASLQHQLQCKVLRMRDHKLAAGETHGARAFPCCSLKSRSALEEIRPVLQTPRRHREHQIFLGLEMEVNRAFGVLYRRGQLIKIEALKAVPGH